MALVSSMILVSDGTLQTVHLTFPFRDKGDVRVYVQGEEVLVNEGWVWSGNNTIRFDNPIPNEATVWVRRLTDLSGVPHIFGEVSGATGRSEFTYVTVDENFEYILEASQDALDSFEFTRGSVESTREWAELAVENAELALLYANAAENSKQLSEAARIASEAAKVAASNSASQAASSATNASNSATTAATLRDEVATLRQQTQTLKESADSAASEALASRNAAKTSENNAKASEVAAEASQTSATNSATSASSSASVASSAATTAQDAASTATTKASEASASASAASSSEANASDSASLAKDWATKTDGTVDGTDYSAKYWAKEAENLVTADTAISTVDSSSISFSGVGSSGDPLSAEVTVSDGEGLVGFGYGRVGTAVGRYADVNDVPKRTGFYQLTDGHPNSTNNKAPTAGFYDTSILRATRQSTNDFVDLYLPYSQYSNGMVIAPHTSNGYATPRIVSDSVNLRTSTGNSTQYPMSQKAVTDALSGKADKQDLTNPDKGATMLARGVVSVDNIADLLALPEEQRRADLRYLVKERVVGSDVGGGEFIWDGSSTEEANGGTVFSPNQSMSGRFVRLFEGALKSYWFLEGDKGDLGYVQKALTFAYTSGLDIDLEHSETFKATAPFTIGPDSGKYTGTISGYLNIDLLSATEFPPEASMLTIRNCTGEISANILANCFERCRVGIEYQGTGGLTLSGDVHARRATKWGHLMTSEFGNTNSMRWLGELRGTICGSNYTQDFQYLSSSNYSSTIATPVISEIQEESIALINERWYHILSSNPEETVIQPALPTEDRTDGSMQIFVGGGYLSRGSDVGVGLIAKMVMQANSGVGMRCAGLYGNMVTGFVGELNAGPSIVVGRSTTSANLKNVFQDSYFEGGPKHRVVVMSTNGQLLMPTHFNLGSDGVYVPPFVTWGSQSAIYVPRQPSAENASSYGAARGTSVTRTVHLGGYYFFRAVVGSSVDYTIELTASSGEVAGGATIILYNFTTRPVIFKCSKGQNINGMPSLTLNQAGTVGITVVKTEDGWALSSFETTILEGS